MELLLGIFIVLLAFFLKGFSGFGPALVMIPMLTLIYDPMTAIIVTAFLDFLAGMVLIFAVRRELNWRFILPVFIALAAGAWIGTSLLEVVSVDILKKVIGAAILLFSLIIFFDSNRQQRELSRGAAFMKYPVGFISGILGRMLSISGPPLVIYTKWFYEKSFFRAQLIGIFLLGAGWRLFLYQIYNIPSSISTVTLILFLVIMFAGLYIGNHVHWSVRESTFNKIIAVIIILPALRLLFF